MTTDEKIPALAPIVAAIEMLEKSLKQCKPIEITPDMDLSSKNEARKFNQYNTGNFKDRIYFCVAGGAIVSAVTGSKINDFDIFSDRPLEIIDRLEQSNHTATYQNEMFANFYINNNKFQIIKRYAIEDPSFLFDVFDFTIVCGALDNNGTFWHEDRFWQDIATRRLVINANPFPLKTLERLCKYSNRGFKPCPVGLLRVAEDIRAIPDLNDETNTLAFYDDGTPRFLGVD